MASVKVVVELESPGSHAANDLRGSIEPKYEFAIEPTFERGAEAAVGLSTKLYKPTAPWGVYVSPRMLELHINRGTIRQTVGGIIIAVSRKTIPAAFYLQVVTSQKIVEEVEQALYAKVDTERRRHVKLALSKNDERTVERIRDAVQEGYVDALMGCQLH